MNDPSGSSQSDPSEIIFPGHRALPPGYFRSLPPSTGPARLASLRTRDMTLIGAPKKPRRTFEPNVNVVRKSKDEIKGQNATPKHQRSEREEKRKERRGVKKEKPRIIQSHSIFEQGPAACSRRTGRGPTVPEPSSSLCDRLKREPEDDSHITLSKLYRDDFIDDPTLKNNSKLNPIQLPLSHTPSLSVSTAHSTARGRNLEVSDTKQPSLVALLSDLCLSDQEELFYIQLPDCLPIKTSGHRATDTANPGPSQTATRNSKEPVLTSFSEGCLGKLQLRRSGKVVLKMGDISMDVTEGTAFSFLQQLVSVRMSEGRSGDMMVLGNVRHKLVLSPDFQTLLDQSETKSP